MPPPYRLVSQIFESEPYPIVVHVFYGDRPEKAIKTYLAHKKSDSFLRECVDTGAFRGRVSCREEHRVEFWTGRMWSVYLVRSDFAQKLGYSP